MDPDRIVTTWEPEGRIDPAPLYRLPDWLMRTEDHRGLSPTEAKRLAQDIRLWLIGIGHETVDEMMR